MGILENFENAWDLHNGVEEHINLANKVFSETVCKDCQCQTESTPIVETDNMGRDILWNKEN